MSKLSKEQKRSILEVYCTEKTCEGTEIDFVTRMNRRIVSIDVKGETNLKTKSLKVYKEKYEPGRCIRISMAEYKDEGWLVNLPLWAVETIDQ